MKKNFDFKKKKKKPRKTTIENCVKLICREIKAKTEKHTEKLLNKKLLKIKPVFVPIDNVLGQPFCFQNQP